MRNFPLTELREKLFGNTFERSKSGSTYKKILGFKVRLSDHYVSKVGGGSTNRGDIEIVLNPDDSFGISLNNREVDDLLYDWLEKESNDTQELDESGVLKMFEYLKSKTRIKKAIIMAGISDYSNQTGLKKSLLDDNDFDKLLMSNERMFIRKPDVKIFKKTTALYFTDGKREIMFNATKPISKIKKLGNASTIIKEVYSSDKYAKGGKMAETKKETYYIDFLNKKKNFSMDRVTFDDYEKAKKWAMKNFESFDPDMIKIKYAKGGGIYEKFKNYGLKGIGKAKDFTKKQIHDQKKKIALEVVDTTKDKYSNSKQKLILKASEELIRNKYAKGGEIGKEILFEIPYFHSKLKYKGKVLSDMGSHFRVKVISNGDLKDKITDVHKSQITTKMAKGGKMGKTNKEKVEEPKDSYVVEVRYYYDNNDNEDGYDEPDYSTEYHTFSSKEEAFAFARKNERNVEEIFYYPKGTDFNPQRLFAKGGILSGFNYSIGGL